MKIIVTRHQGLVDWLAAQGITGKVITHASLEDVKDKDVIGVLPLHLAAHAASITVVDIPDLPPDMRGKDLSPDQLDMFGATLTKYTVTREAT